MSHVQSRMHAKFYKHLGSAETVLTSGLGVWHYSWSTCTEARATRVDTGSGSVGFGDRPTVQVGLSKS
jgi:hypothetical protein